MTKLCIFSALLSAVVLVGCDRDLHVDNRSIVPDDNNQDNFITPGNPNTVKPEPKTKTNPSARNSNVIYGQLLDFETPKDDDEINAVLSSADPSLAKEILNGTIKWDATEPNRPENSKESYTIESSGYDESSRHVKIKTRGDTLTKAGEFVAIHELNTGGKIGLQSAGTPKTGSDLPKGSQRYEGKVIIRKNNNPDTQLSGDFFMGVDFTNAKVDYIDADAGKGDEKLIFKADSADDMMIDRLSGAFSTDSATIGLSNGATESASINGYFSGTDAEGVHGLAYSNDTQNYTGAFYGKISQ